MTEYASPEVLVSTEWLQKHGKEEKLRIVEVDVDTALYEEGHIECAVGWDWRSQLQDQIRRDILGKEEFEKLMSDAGISNDTTVILYGDNNNWFAAHALWQMKIYGHQDVRLMNGGRKKWMDENRYLTTDVPEYTISSYRASVPDWSIRARRQEVLETQGDLNQGALVDVRSPDEFTGKIIAPPGLPETAQRAGHIPGAKNIPWGQAVREDGTFKSADELSQLYGSQKVLQNEKTITYCRIGERSSHTWFVLKYLLGYPEVANYDGSWTEWGNLVDAPVATGQK